MVSYIEDYGVTFRTSCLRCGVLLCARDIRIAGGRGEVVPANAHYTPGRPTLLCKACIEVTPESKFSLVDFEKLRGDMP